MLIGTRDFRGHALRSLRGKVRNRYRPVVTATGRVSARKTGGEAIDGTSTMSERGDRAAEKHIGARIRLRRCELGILAPQLAAVVSMQPGELAAIEAGETRPGAAQFYAIAQALQTSIRYFF